jgi:glyoxylase-like metal-dependent hydrolase (beta-lactamase superfamily II)
MRMTATITIGSAEIIALTDGVGPFFAERDDVFPNATAQQWAAADRFDPDAVTAEGRWRLPFRGFAIRTGSQTVVVDAGFGPADGPGAGWSPDPGSFPAELAAADIEPADVDTVVLTHLHTDHVGWAVVPEGAGQRPFFPDARYLLQQTELDVIDELNPQLRASLIDPLRATGQLGLVDGEDAIGPAISVVPTPGHTPGHQSVLVEFGQDLVAVTGDVLVHAVQLLFPELPYRFETDPEAARKTREALLRRVAAVGGRLATPHLTEPFVAVPHGGS